MVGKTECALSIAMIQESFLKEVEARRVLRKGEGNLLVLRLKKRLSMGKTSD